MSEPTFLSRRGLRLPGLRLYSVTLRPFWHLSRELMTKPEKPPSCALIVILSFGASPATVADASASAATAAARTPVRSFRYMCCLLGIDRPRLAAASLLLGVLALQAAGDGHRARDRLVEGR